MNKSASEESSSLGHLEDFGRIIDALPPVNWRILALIMRHLRRVADMAEENQMSAKNLSIIFGPTLMSSSNRSSVAIVDNIHQARAIELMITWADQMFPNQALQPEREGGEHSACENDENDEDCSEPWSV